MIAWLSLSIFVVSAVREYVAIAPAGGGAAIVSSTLEWVLVEYPEGVSSTSNVTLSAVPQGPKELGFWWGLETGGLALTSKIVDDVMYALVDKTVKGTGGCCADTLRIYPRDSKTYTEIDLDPLVQKAVNSSTAHASHTFDVSVFPDGSLVGLFQVKYNEAALSNPPCDAIVAINLKTHSLVPTADGLLRFDMFAQAGTLSIVDKDSRFKIQFYTDTTGTGSEQWHGNGVLRFTSKASVDMLAFTHRFMSEAVVFKDPWTYKASQGGGAIHQRFGTPWHWTTSTDSTYRYFGLNSDSAPFTSGVHNVFYRSSAEALGGKESLSLFVNQQGTKSAVYEFALIDVIEGPIGESSDPGDDTVFATDYVFAVCSFDAKAQGGARAIGDGVFLVMSGIDATGLEVVDSAGSTKSYAYTLGGSPPHYDPFIRVVLD